MPTLVPLDNTLGVNMAGVTISAAIYGITCLQTYLYYTQHCSRDRPGLKIFVAIVILLDTMHLATLVVTVYRYTVLNFGNNDFLIVIDWTLMMAVAIGSVLGGLVQCYFALRVYRLSGNRVYVPVFVGTLTLAKQGVIAAYIVHTFKIRTFQNDATDVSYPVASLAIDIANDLVVALQMIYYLQKRRTRFYGTARAVNLLITYAVNTCFLTSIFCFIAALLLGIFPKTLIYAAFYYIAERLYCCSLMSSLNLRDTVRDALHPKAGDFISLGAVATPTVRTGDATDAPGHAGQKKPVGDWADSSGILEIGAKANPGPTQAEL